ncbi:hypothetical protein [Sphingomonas morindae]|uniref:Uncharacterized protein n=1 Tax=Sphingomonas morindae TaxID=1541170 RepID=A0ABY4XAH4_9SPHN|nr:hypothetical protein [Sphingomonas morindae]USI73875.1 hypothetical protein LHA26_05245 [Sphingomonas morindae]
MEQPIGSFCHKRTTMVSRLNDRLWSPAALQLRQREDPDRFTAKLPLDARRRTTSAAAEMLAAIL